MALCTGNHELYGRRRRPDSIEVQQMKAQAKEAKNARDAEREKLAAERKARELMEERYRKMELAMQEQELAYEMSQSALTDYQRKVKELEAQLEDEKRARMELENMQRRLEEVNRQLEIFWFPPTPYFAEQELQPLENLSRPEDSRQVMAATNMDHAKRLEVMRKDLDATRDRRKLQQVDIRYEENLSKGMDKYRTLHAIRQGNTKKRVEQFESL
ncbi:unnamed protein product [Echinostoma caproni]|uniref:ERM domain-containing protein n=1 Tax=Echinostoma caproni TaxID=27848 RepID=A0A183AJX4_9TREM|nr:unnamed protein product [Echinostoma caproni]